VSTVPDLPEELEPMPQRVLFVCVENSCRSQMAEAFARRMGGDAVEAVSAGSRPSGVVNPKAIAAMGELGYDLAQHSSKPLDQVPQIEWDLAITMGCGDECPNVRAKARADWGIPDPKHMAPAEFAAVRDGIARRVDELARLAHERTEIASEFGTVGRRPTTGPATGSTEGPTTP
jgi:arsenate reductase